MNRVLAVAGLAALGACSGSFDERVHDEFHQTVYGPVTTVRVGNVAGSVRIDGWARSAVDVRATKYGYDASELRSISIGVRKEGDGVSIETSYGGGTHRGGVRYRISVPAAAAVDVSNIAGAVDVSGVTGDLTVETQAGEITADAGRVAGNRSIDLRATTGAITLSIAPNSDASVDAASTVGDLASDIPSITKVRQNIVGVRGSGRIGSGSARIRLGTTTGAIDLRQR